MPFAYFVLQQDSFEFGTKQFQITDDELLEFNYRVGTTLGVDAKG